MALGRLVQVRDEPNALAASAVVGTLYGQNHPYGQPSTARPPACSRSRGPISSSSTQAQIRPGAGHADRRRRCHDRRDRRRNWRRLSAGWKAGGRRRRRRNSPPPPRRSRPASCWSTSRARPQSVISVAQIGADRNSPDYFALAVMNSIFGGQFSSRLEHEPSRSRRAIPTARARRSTGGSASPARSLATASVQTAVTAPALVEFLKEFEGMVGKRPVGLRGAGFLQDLPHARLPRRLRDLLRRSPTNWRPWSSTACPTTTSTRSCPRSPP